MKRKRITWLNMAGSYKISVNFLFLTVLVLFMQISCTKRIIIPASYDAALFSDLAETNISGKTIISPERGFGTIIKFYGSAVTYPVLYLGSGEEDSVKDSFVLGGFDLSGLEGRGKVKLKRAYLKMYVHHVSFPRKNIIFFVRPLKGPWKEDTITYLDVYETTRPNANLTGLVESDEKNCLLVHFDSEATVRSKKDSFELPNGKGSIISIDVTRIVQGWLENPGSNFGLLMDPMWKSDIRYSTTNPTNELTSFGLIEIAPTEWYSWDGTAPGGAGDLNRKKIINKTRGSLKFIPRLEIFYTSR